MTTSFNSAALRELLITALTDEDLTILAFDHFRPVYDDFATGMSKGQNIQRLLDFCSRREQVEALLASVQKANPTRYAQYEQRTVILDGLLN